MYVYNFKENDETECSVFSLFIITSVLYLMNLYPVTMAFVYLTTSQCQLCLCNFTCNIHLFASFFNFM